MMTLEEMREATTALLEKLDIIPMHSISFVDRQREGGIIKAGLVPFYVTEEGNILFYLYRPEENAEFNLGKPQFQIPKGTREGLTKQGEWEDYSPRHKKNFREIEELSFTAVREAIEECGLVTDNVHSLFDFGIVEFLSAKNKIPKTLWLFSAYVEDRENFISPHATLATTETCEWFDITREKDATEIRPDHLEILQDVHRKLSAVT